MEWVYFNIPESLLLELLCTEGPSKGSIDHGYQKWTGQRQQQVSNALSWPPLQIRDSGKGGLV